MNYQNAREFMTSTCNILSFM